jgi:hypothetical protein
VTPAITNSIAAKVAIRKNKAMVWALRLRGSSQPGLREGGMGTGFRVSVGMWGRWAGNLSARGGISLGEATIQCDSGYLA